ncbi:ABC transporter ATP-binding protein [Saccharibacillus alkalitolerans]|uniref:ABC transporter ATP-binding protein n=1 Tax=Saccharibacillus alkalitolerans TaxID=2705290 RepID=A0ABX0FC09_9BACL|nr:ABC transporter ATP-binding protein [Saccharibacillus alkalitolerans]NGZ77088.1 ABC transporter ATP-binding protein [Saccharibacillus alkalitolerans]
MNMLTLSHVCKSFGGRPVVDDLSFSVKPHTIFGFIGQNGAGKTTTMKMILGLLAADRGNIEVNGEQVAFGRTRTNRHIGYLSDVPEFYGFMTPGEYLELCGKIARMAPSQARSKSAELLKLVGLDGADTRIQGFSRGMKQRLGMAQALLNDPPLLICDEPTSSLDPLGRKEILELMLLAKNRTTVVFSTHILSDVERICDEAAFLHQGRIIRGGTLEEIRAARREDGPELEVEFYSAADAERFKARFSAARMFSLSGVRLEAQDEEAVPGILEMLARERLPVRRFERLEPTLEDLFAEMVRG